MPLYLDRTTSADGPGPRESSRCGAGMHETSDRLRPTLTIGLVNNMQDGALETTERQFISLLEAASEDIVVRLRFYQLPGILRGASATRHVANRHSDIETMWDAPLDGLVVTGREPSTTRLQDEPYWDSFVRLLGWAHDHTHSTIWSCLAAHAAVLQMDGIPRLRSAHKNHGLFDCQLLSDHPMTAGTPSHFRIPHSRWNGLDEKQLVEHGYEILSRSECVGVDAFVRENRSLFLFFQGHPEYEANTLLLEYRRDVGRYLRGEAAVYPSLPQSYFDDHTTAALREIGHEARLFPREELLSDVSAALEGAKLQHSWQPTAVSIYRNWLSYLAAAKGLPFPRSTDVSALTDISKPKRVIATAEFHARHAPMPVRSLQDEPPSSPAL